MRISLALAADLALLTQALEGSSADLASTLALLASQAVVGIPSYVGLSVQFELDNARVVITTMETAVDIAEIGTSLRFPLTGIRDHDAEPASFVLVLYAREAGALVDLAADLAWLTGRPLEEIVLDEDRAGLGVGGKSTPLRSTSTVNQALGVLIGSGLTAVEARAELQRRATADGVDELQTAEKVLRSLP